MIQYATAGVSIKKNEFSRETLGKGIATRKMRPILAHSNAIRRDSGAQTDISAIPGSSWRSESSLANKVTDKIICFKTQINAEF